MMKLKTLNSLFDEMKSEEKRLHRMEFADMKMAQKIILFLKG